MLARLHKLAFGTNAFSGPMNPNIESGASTQAPPKPVTLRRGIQKTAELLPGYFMELMKCAADVNVGQWWESTGGPFLGKGGHRRAFKKLMDKDGIPDRFQTQFMHTAKTRYNAPYSATTKAVGDVAKKLKPHLGTIVPLAGAAAVLGGLELVNHHNKKKREAAKKKTAAGAPTRGNFMMASDIPAFKAPRLDRAIQKDGGFEDKKEKDGDGESLMVYSPGDFKRSKYAMPMEELGAFVADLLEKEAEVSPAVSWNGATNNSSRQPSIIPPYKHPRLDRAIQKESGAYLNHAALNLGQAARDVRYLGDHPAADKVAPKGSAHHVAASVTARVPSLAGNLYYAALPPQLHHTKADIEELKNSPNSLKDILLNGYAPWKHKLKEGSMTPAGQLNKAQHVGAPKASAPPGPSIADIAKPKGAKFGIGIPGAFKTHI